jgi:hypothetical protein
MPVRPGFIIPAAGTTTANLPSSQPDQGDFVTLGNQRYGVVAGCDLSYIPGGAGQPGTVRIGSGPNLVKVDDTLYTIATSTEAMVSTTVGVGDRIDLVVYDATRGLSVVTGAPASDPIMPDISTSMTLLFILYVQLVNAKVTVIDKRIFLARSMISTIGPTTTLVQNRDSAGNPLVTILGDGTVQWGVNDAFLQRTGINELTLNSKLIVGTVVAESMAINGASPVTSATNSRGTTLPPTGEIGDMFTNTTTGAVYVYQASGWVALLTHGSVPVGTVIQSQLEFEPNKDTVLAGFLPMDGRTIAYVDYPAYFAARGVGSGTLTLTDARGCYLAQPAGGSAAIGTKFGNASNRVTLAIANLAEHRHETTNQTNQAGAHIPTGSTTPGGAHTPAVAVAGGTHTHIAFDSGHLHPPEWPNDGLGFLTDTPNPHFNVRGGPIGVLHPATTLPYPDHNYPGPAGDATNRAYLAVPAETTGVGNANIGVVADGSHHTHEMAAVPHHAHGIQLDPVGSHSHTVPIHNPVGGNQPLDITPSSLAINYYVKVA